MEEIKRVAKQIWLISENDRFSKDYELRRHIRRTAGSIMDIIAEGFERDGNREFLQFLYVSKGSAGELKSQLYRALDLNYILSEDLDLLYKQADEISKMLNGLIEYLKSSEFKGKNFK